LSANIGFSQTYTSYFIGNSTDIASNPSGGVCLMGGATEDDNAMKWFLERADGGDILVLRATGSDGYNSYLHSELGVEVNSVETIVCHSEQASSEPYLIQKIEQAEAIWFAGGNQWTYISYWRNSAVSEAINEAISQRNIVIGGTSAGMAIQSQYYFSAQNGTVTSSNALSNPYNEKVAIDSTSFIESNFLHNTITDTHFDNPDRKGRILVFLARIFQDDGVLGRAIACDEYTAVCIGEDGIARVFGGYPNYDDNAYFIQSNCELATQGPEECSPGNPLTWNLNEEAVKVYVIKGDASGDKSFDVGTWQEGSGGVWENWSVSNGDVLEQGSEALNCSPTSSNEIAGLSNLEMYPNPASNKVTISLTEDIAWKKGIYLFNNLGRQINLPMEATKSLIEVDISTLRKGVFYFKIYLANGEVRQRKIIKM